ncbi:BACON domain-containing protein [uncultured Bacteroides sp.]|uniref:BACON domain-containing protein n=1 Tax=uncultured Bacteroides sp. TaxID=162156 RepID=UPI0026032FF7|nr:BACON domain-containing protein [uncultured Bacteroides sp.]
MEKFWKRWMVLPFMALAVTFGATSCSSDDDDAPSAPAGTFELKKDVVEVAAEGGDAYVRYALDTEGEQQNFEVTPDADWVHISEKGSTARIKFTVDPNTSTEPRECEVTVVYSDEYTKAIETSFTVKQAGMPAQMFTVTSENGGVTYLPFEVVPSDNTMRYIASIMSADDMEGYTSLTNACKDDLSSYQSYADQYGMSLVDFIDEAGVAFTGPQSDYAFVQLEPSTDYVIIVYGVDDNGNVLEPASSLEVRTKDISAYSNNIKLTVDAVTSNTATMSFSVDNFETYVYGIYTTEAVNAASQDEINSALAASTPMYGNVEEGTIKGLKPSTSYTVLYAGIAGSTLTTPVQSVEFTTSEGESVGEITSELNYVYFEGADVSDYLEGGMDAGIPLIMSTVKTNCADWYLALLTYDAELDKFSDEDWYSVLPEFGFNSDDSPILMLGEYDVPMLFVYAVVDPSTGELTALKKEKFTATTDGVMSGDKFMDYYYEYAGVSSSMTSRSALNYGKAISKVLTKEDLNIKPKKTSLHNFCNWENNSISKIRKVLKLK